MDQTLSYQLSSSETKNLMRIIGGELKGRRLCSLTGSKIRPTSDRLRESLFNLLGQRMDGEFVLDGYAGSGAFGIEAISRGAAFCCMVDQSPDSIGSIKTNLDLCRIPTHRYQVIHQDFEHYISMTDMQFDTIFLDPPYRAYDQMSIPVVIDQCGHHLRRRGRIVFEHSAAQCLLRQELGPRWNVVSRKSGQSMITILQSES